MKKIIFTEIQQKQIIEDYKNGHGSSFIAKKLGITHNPILNLLRNFNIVINQQTNYSHRKYKFNENYFEKIDSKDKAYFLGLMLADGNNYKNVVRIELQENDKEILEIFKNYLNLSKSLRYIKPRIGRNAKGTYILEISSKKFTYFANKVGIIPNKTFKTKFPEISKDLYSHFIRGYFDGDGSIWINNIKKGTWGTNFTGNIKLIQKIKEILVKECNLFNSKIHKKGEKGIGTFASCGNKQVYRIGQYLYKDCEDLYLTRKKEKFDKVSFTEFPKTCSICNKKIEAKGLCARHYHQNRYKQSKIIYKYVPIIDNMKRDVQDFLKSYGAKGLIVGKNKTNF